MEHTRVSEGYLIFQRAVTFLDEWLFYGLLLYLFVNQYWLIMIPVALLGSTFIWISYKRQWAMEEQRFGPLWKTDIYLHHDKEESPELTKSGWFTRPVNSPIKSTESDTT